MSARGPDILRHLESKGVTVDRMIDAAMALYVPHKKVDGGKSPGDIARRFESEARKQCQDPNVFLLIQAALYLDNEFPRKDSEKKTGPAFIVADELIGMSIAEYIGGKKALFNFVRYDRKKPGILSELGVFLDDAVGGLIAGCMTKIFED